LFASPAYEDKRGIKRNTALRKHARQLHRQYRAASIVVGARCVGFMVEVGALLWVGGTGRRHKVLLAAQVDRVVVTADVDATGRASWKNGDHVSQFDTACDAPLGSHLVGVE